MKIFIWFLCILAFSIIETLFKTKGILLGAIPTVLLMSAWFALARYFCRIWDEHKALVSAAEKKYGRQKKWYEKIFFSKPPGVVPKGTAYVTRDKATGKGSPAGILKTVVCIIALAALVIIVALSKTVTELNNELSNLRSDYDTLEQQKEDTNNELLSCKEELARYRTNFRNSISGDWERKANFLDTHVVLVTTTGSRYHRFDCQHISGPFYAYNVNFAVLKGYRACLDCEPPTSD